MKHCFVFSVFKFSFCTQLPTLQSGSLARCRLFFDSFVVLCHFFVELCCITSHIIMLFFCLEPSYIVFLMHNVSYFLSFSRVIVYVYARKLFCVVAWPKSLIVRSCVLKIGSLHQVMLSKGKFGRCFKRLYLCYHSSLPHDSIPILFASKYYLLFVNVFMRLWLHRHFLKGNIIMYIDFQWNLYHFSFNHANHLL